MEITAEAKYIKMSPRKIRLVAQAIKKLAPTLAIEQLGLIQKAAAASLAAVLRSALANATGNAKLAAENMKIKSIIVGQGPMLKRWRPVSRGRSHAYKKKMSHIKIVLEDSHGTKN